MFEFTGSLLNSSAHLVWFVLTRPLINPMMRHTIVVNASDTDEAIRPTDTALFPVDLSTPEIKKNYTNLSCIPDIAPLPVYIFLAFNVMCQERIMMC